MQQKPGTYKILSLPAAAVTAATRRACGAHTLGLVSWCAVQMELGGSLEVKISRAAAASIGLPRRRFTAALEELSSWHWVKVTTQKRKATRVAILIQNLGAELADLGTPSDPRLNDLGTPDDPRTTPADDLGTPSDPRSVSSSADLGTPDDPRSSQADRARMIQDAPPILARQTIQDADTSQSDLGTLDDPRRRDLGTPDDPRSRTSCARASAAAATSNKRSGSKREPVSAQELKTQKMREEIELLYQDGGELDVWIMSVLDLYGAEPDAGRVMMFAAEVMHAIQDSKLARQFIRERVMKHRGTDLIKKSSFYAMTARDAHDFARTHKAKASRESSRALRGQPPARKAPIMKVNDYEDEFEL